MFLNNYWKVKSAIDGHKAVYYSGNRVEVQGYDYGVKKADGTSLGYVVSTWGTAGMGQSSWGGSTGASDESGAVQRYNRYLGIGNAVKLATGDANISANDYVIAGTDITSSFSGLSIAVTIGTENGKEVYTCVITGIYNGSDPVELKRIGITKDVYYCTSQTQNNYSTPLYAPILIVEHELATPISLSNGDPLNIILKITQQ